MDYRIGLLELLEDDRNCNCGGRIERVWDESDEHEWFAPAWDVCAACGKVYRELPRKLSGIWECLIEDRYGNLLATGGGDSREAAERNAKEQLARFEADDCAGDE